MNGLPRKYRLFFINQIPSSTREPLINTTTKERVTSIDASVGEPEKTLLQRGPKFVPTHEKLKAEDLKRVESAIESTMNALRFVQEVGNTRDEGTNVSKDNAEEVEYNLLTEPKIRRLINVTQHAKQPPKMDTDSERRAEEVKSNIMQAYKQYQPSKRNITRKGKSALGRL